MPTLPGFTIWRRFASRANGMCVCPQTTVMTSSGSPARTSVQRSRRESTTTTSASSRGVAWQNRTGPNPPTSSSTESGSDASQST